MEGEAWQENDSIVQSVNSVLRYWGMPTADKLKSKVAGTQGRLCTIRPVAQANQVCGRARRAYYRPKNEQTTTWAEPDIFIMTSRMAANWTEKCTGAPILKKVGKLSFLGDRDRAEWIEAVCSHFKLFFHSMFSSMQTRLNFKPKILILRVGLVRPTKIYLS